MANEYIDNTEADDRDRLVAMVPRPATVRGYLNETADGIHIKFKDDIFNIHTAYLKIDIGRKYRELNNLSPGQELTDRIAYDTKGKVFRILDKNDSSTDCYTVKWQPLLSRRMESLLSFMANKESEVSVFSTVKNWIQRLPIVGTTPPTLEGDTHNPVHDEAQGSVQSTNTDSTKTPEEWVKEFRRLIDHEQDNGFMKNMTVNQKEAMIESLVTLLEEYLPAYKRETPFESFFSHLRPSARAIFSSPAYHMFMLQGVVDLAGLQKPRLAMNTIHGVLFIATLLSIDHIAKSAIRLQPHSITTTPMPDVLSWTLTKFRFEHEKQKELRTRQQIDALQQRARGLVDTLATLPMQGPKQKLLRELVDQHIATANRLQSELKEASNQLAKAKPWNPAASTEQKQQLAEERLTPIVSPQLMSDAKDFAAALTQCEESLLAIQRQSSQIQRLQAQSRHLQKQRQQLDNLPLVEALLDSEKLRDSITAQHRDTEDLIADILTMRRMELNKVLGDESHGLTSQDVMQRADTLLEQSNQVNENHQRQLESIRSRLSTTSVSWESQPDDEREAERISRLVHFEKIKPTQLNEKRDFDNDLYLRSTKNGSMAVSSHDAESVYPLVYIVPPEFQTTAPKDLKVGDRVTFTAEPPIQQSAIEVGIPSGGVVGSSTNTTAAQPLNVGPQTQGNRTLINRLSDGMNTIKKAVKSRRR